MPGNAKFIASEPARAWLTQFGAADEPLAIEMLRKMRLVSRDSFADGLQRMLGELIVGGKPVALYVEREVSRAPTTSCGDRGGVLPLFEQPDEAPQRATGKRPAMSSLPNKHEMGSEGVVGQLVTEMCRKHPDLAFDHPGPDVIRAKKIRRLVFVTDCIASGQRICDNLTSAWEVASVRGWWSNRQKYGCSFSVVAYAATDSGKKRVEEHPAKPEVRIAARCPTVSDSFSRHRVTLFRELCAKYAPENHARNREKRGAARRSLGYGGMGTLIAFAHGAPNNTPTMFWRESGTWIPLFRGRVTADARHSFDSELSVTGVQDRLQMMRQKRLAESMAHFQLAGPAGAMVLTLAASGRTPGNRPAIAEATGLTGWEVISAIDNAIASGWLDTSGRLTDAGRRQLNSFRSKVPSRESAVQTGSDVAYYPLSLRVPVPSV